MKNKLQKALSLLLAVSMLIIPASFVSSATETPQSASTYLAASDGSVELDGTNDGTVTVSLVANEAFNCYGIEGTWDTTVQQGNTQYLKLTALSFGDLVADSLDYIDVASGKVMWTDLTFPADPISKDAKLLTATYKVAAGTPEGTYTVKFVSEAFTGADGETDETATLFTATITVKRHNPTVQAGQAATCEEDGWNAYYQCPICNKIYSDAEGKNEISNLDAWKVGDGKILATNHAWGDPSYTNTDGDTHTANYVCDNDESHTKSETVEHDFTGGVCACGKAAPVATGLKGDVDLDDDVDIDDVVALMRHVLKDYVLENSTSLANGETTGNGELDIDDVVKLMRYVLKDINSLD